MRRLEREQERERKYGSERLKEGVGRRRKRKKKKEDERTLKPVDGVKRGKESK